jgi:hypothetical protein
MRWLRITMLVLLILAGQTARADIQWRVMRTAHFMIYYSAGHDSTARDAANVAEKWRVILARKLQYTPTDITPIFLYPDRPSFADATGTTPGSTIIGMAHTRTYKVRVDASGAYADVAHIIPHELVHVYVTRMLKGNAIRLPLWMHEGLAKYLADDWTGPDAELLADTAASGQIMPLERISRAFPTDDHGLAVAYVESYSAVRYMSEKFSPQAILDLFGELEKNEPFEMAMFNSLGQEPAKFDEDWQAFLWDKYGTMRWAKNISTAASGTMAILAIFAFRARLIKKRRKAEEFQQDGQDDQDSNV